MDKKRQKKSLTLPGLTISGSRVRRELEKAAQLEMDGPVALDNDSVSTTTQQRSPTEKHATLSKQNATFHTCVSMEDTRNNLNIPTPTHPQLKHQSKSEPSLPNYHFKEVQAVQESSEVTNSNNGVDLIAKEDLSRPDISEQGRRARNHYRSSGYGTKSDDNSQNESACSNNQMDEEDHLFDETAASNVDIDNDPPTTYNGSNVNANERLVLQQTHGNGEKSIITTDTHSSEKGNDLASGDRSSDSFEIEIESGIFQSSLPKCGNDFDSFLMNQRHSWDHYRLREFLFNRQDLRTISSSFFEIIARFKESSPREKPQVRSRLRTGSKEVPMSLKQDFYSSEANYFYDPIIQKMLEKSARCHDITCQECAEMRNHFKALSDPNISIQNRLNEESKKILMHMYDHSIHCTLARCPFYWCDIIPKYLSNPEEILYLMKRRVEPYILEPFLGNVGEEVFVKLDFRIPEYPREDVDWTVLVRLGHSRNTVLVLPTNQDKPDNLELWVVKKVPLIEGDSQTMLYDELRKLQEPGIVQHLWAAHFTKPEIFIVCTLYADLSLQEIVKHQPITSLKVLVDLMLQIIIVLQHLHQKGILFLNWSGSNIIIDQVHMKLKLADFTASTLINQFEYDSGALEAYLPKHLHPPEFLELPRKLDTKSDVWGLGCLLHEMVNGKPVWYQFQHETLDDLLKKMKSYRCPVIPSSIKELPVVFKACWEFKGDDRPKLEELKILMTKALERQQGENCNTTTINLFSH